MLGCELWLYWSLSPHPLISERKMLSGFKTIVGQLPFANFDGKRRPGVFNSRRKPTHFSDTTHSSFRYCHSR
jgi:hypothetical protein